MSVGHRLYLLTGLLTRLIGTEKTERDAEDGHQRSRRSARRAETSETPKTRPPAAGRPPNRYSACLRDQRASASWERIIGVRYRYVRLRHIQALCRARLRGGDRQASAQRLRAAAGHTGRAVVQPERSLPGGQPGTQCVGRVAFDPDREGKRLCPGGAEDQMPGRRRPCRSRSAARCRPSRTIPRPRRGRRGPAAASRTARSARGPGPSRTGLTEDRIGDCRRTRTRAVRFAVGVVRPSR